MLVALITVAAFAGTAVAAKKAKKTSGIVAAYEVGKSIKLKGSKNQEWTFEIASDAKVTGEVKEGANVTVSYSKDGDKMVVSAISVAPEKKAKKKM
jgi:hypothetical protein